MLARLLDLILPPRPSAKFVRDANEEALLSFLQPEPVPTGVYEAVALLPYQESLVQACVLEAKYRGNKKAVRMLGRALAEYLAEEVSDASAFGARSVLVPVPLSPVRLKERGYNQAERICTAAAEHLPGGVPVRTDVLIRSRDTAPQTKLSGSERHENVKGAFSAPTKLDPSLLYIVVDDVTTTGATLLSASSALSRAGAKQILPIALAH